MKVITVRSLRARVRKVKGLIQSAGNQIGAVHFIKRSDGTKRRMAYRLHVAKPTYAAKPTGKRFKTNRSKDADNLQVTVFDVNHINYNHKDRMSGRGAWRTIPLENVTRIAVGGEIYKIIS
jgi:hypothetical protein